MVARIDHIVLTVADVAASSEWYRRVLDMQVIWFGAGRVALRFGEQKINLHPSGAELAPHARVPQCGSADFCLVTETALAEVEARLRACEVPIELGPVEKQGALGPIESVYFRDPDGNLVEVASYRESTREQRGIGGASRSVPNAPRRRRLYQVDAFTRQRFAGNPAGVVLDADGLSEAEMQQIAAELGNSETAFLFPADGPGHDVRIRYFTPTTEVPLCGHATIAAHYVRAVVNRLPPGTLVQRGLAGDLTVELGDDDGDHHVTLTLAPPAFSPPLPNADVERLLHALGVSPDVLLPGAPPQIVAAGHSKVILGVRSRDVLFRLTPDMAELTRLSTDIRCNGYHVFTFDTGDPATLTSARMFAPAIGVPEDPVTGNGNGPLGAYIVRHRLVEHDGARLAFRAAQGESVGRPGFVHVTVDIANGEPVRVRIGRDAVIVFEAVL